MKREGKVEGQGSGGDGKEGRKTQREKDDKLPRGKIADKNVFLKI